MKNEFMAYIMQQDIKSVANYFVRIANFQSTNNAIPELCEYIRNTNAAALEDAAYAFESYVNDRWGLACGRVALVTRLLR